jgi:hypothetical protein
MRSSSAGSKSAASNALFQRVDRDVDRLDRGLDQRRRIGRPPFESAHRRRQASHRRLVAADGVLRLAQVGGDLLALHHGGAAGGERGLLAVLWRELFQFIGGVPQVIGLARRALHAGAVVIEQPVGLAPGFPELFKCCDILLEAGKRIEQAAMGRGIDQRALVMLAVNLDQRSSQRFQGLNADGLIVDEGAGAAVGELHPAQDHFAGVFQAVLGKQRRRWMALRHIEHRRHLALLGAVADQGGIAATAQRQREGIKQNRFARAGLAGQNREPPGELDIEPFDQDDVTDRQTRQHARMNPNRWNQN